MSNQLNEKQIRAVHHVEGPALVVAGAGSGKTRVVTFRITHLLSLGIPSGEILAVTFTNKAADEMRRRVERLSNHFVLTSTFHSLGAKILRESIQHLGYSNNFTIYDEDDSEKVLKECLVALNVNGDKGFLKAARMAISGAKNGLVSPKDLAREDPTVGALYEMYQAKLKVSEAVDFDDLLYLPIVLFQAHPDVLKSYQDRWNYILIDEYQDTNHAQHLLIKLLAGRHHNVFAVGDPDQSIYSWRGANVDNILNFEKDFPGAIIITLDQNYRSPATILNAANALIQNNPSRYEKNLWSTLGPGDKIGLYVAENDHQEAEFVARKINHHLTDFPLEECVIFYRTNFQSRIFEDMFLKVKIPYVIIGGVSFYQRREIKDILSLLRIVLAGADFIALARTINIPKRGLGEKALEKIREGATLAGLSLFDFCTALIDRKVELKLSTKQMEGMRDYVTMILALKEMVLQKVSLQTLVSEAIERSRYEDHLKEDPETFSERRENIAELVTKAAEWEQENPEGTLAGFLEELTLKTSSDAKEPLSDSVKLMTLHNGKGLEFSVVFLVGMEEDLFPHVNSIDSETALEEERRLCYVGMTRAKAHLYLTSAKYRFLWGGARMMRPSRFLAEVPSEYINELTPRPRSAGTDEELNIGDTVHHRDFGLGIIQRQYETSLGMTYDVFFSQSSRVHSLVAKYAKLIKASEYSTD